MNTTKKVSNTTKQTDALGISVCTGNYLCRSIENSPTDTKKELARKFRHEAYIRAKEFRKTDPRQIALKEAQKEFQHEAYQEAKKRNKAYRDEMKKAAAPRQARRPTAGKTTLGNSRRTKKTIRQDKLMGMVVRGNAIKGTGKVLKG